MDASEQALVEAAKRDPARFAPLYETHFERIYAFIVRRVRDRSLAEDLTADVFRRALAGIGGFEWRGVPFSAWLYRIAANEIVNHASRSARERGPTEGTGPVSGKRTGETMNDSAQEGTIDITDEIERAEHRATLFRHVDALPPDQRRVVVMRFAEERSVREIAAELGRSEGAIKQLQWRALQTLRSRMGPSHG
ncbi:MAG TPA: sigma-70 family RNA polymerase sigma factor [Thermoanaerobaculia bacterium]|nr:sigma-70 family RNA polymerase sigma factor [Thermoanaerobaculia bacterium]